MSITEAARHLKRGALGWPVRLEQLGDREVPKELWVRGTLPAPDTPCVAVVGARRATPGGLLSARDIGVELAAAGITVVSGMARGIDAAAHRGALRGGGRTIAVLGCGIDLCYPPEHLELRDQIAASGCVLSEDGGLAPPDGWRFPKRNRVIAMLAEAVIVVEATENSGALSTARWAADKGIEVLAVPGSVRSPASAGSNLLLRDGAPLYLDISDLFGQVPALRRACTAASPAEPNQNPGNPSAPSEGLLLDRLLDQVGTDPVHPDDLAATLRVASSELATALTILQVRGAITEVCGGRVARTF